MLYYSTGYIVLSTLILWNLILAKGHYTLKLITIASTILFGLTIHRSLTSLEGWPTKERVPIKFEVKYFDIREPNRQSGDPGAIFLLAYSQDDDNEYLIDLHDDNYGFPQPRLYHIKYSRRLHEAAKKANEMLKQGKRVQGTREGVEGTGSGNKKGKKGDGKGKGHGEGKKGNGGLSGDSWKGHDEMIFYELSPPKMPSKD